MNVRSYTVSIAESLVCTFSLFSPLCYSDKVRLSFWKSIYLLSVYKKYISSCIYHTQPFSTQMLMQMLNKKEEELLLAKKAPSEEVTQMKASILKLKQVARNYRNKAEKLDNVDIPQLQEAYENAEETIIRMQGQISKLTDEMADLEKRLAEAREFIAKMPSDEVTQLKALILRLRQVERSYRN